LLRAARRALLLPAATLPALSTLSAGATLAPLAFFLFSARSPATLAAELPAAAMMATEAALLTTTLLGLALLAFLASVFVALRLAMVG
jgi:hypothetical protein